MNEHDYALRDAAMAEFVDSYFKARPQLPRTRHEECLVEAGFKAAWKPDQTERAEKAEAELAELREQDPVRWHVRGNYFHDGDAAILFASMNSMCGAKVEQLYAAPAPAVAAPAEWRDALQEAHDTFQRYADLHRAKDTPDGREKAKANQKLANKLYTLLQSAEVKL